MGIPKFNISALRQSIQRQQSELKRDIFRSVAMDIWESSGKNTEKQKKNQKPKFEPGYVYLYLEYQEEIEGDSKEIKSALLGFLDDNLEQMGIDPDDVIQEFLLNEISFSILSYDHNPENEMYSVWYKSVENVYDVFTSSGIPWDEYEDYLVSEIVNFYGGDCYIIPPMMTS
jgi:hypothetical protein